MINIIAPLFQHDIISKQLLEDKTLVEQVTLLPLNSYIDKLVIHNDNNYDKNLKKTLVKLTPDLSILCGYTENETFIKSIKEFHISMYLNNIQLSDLDVSNSKNQDLKLIFQSIQDLIPNEIIKYNKLKDYLEKNKLKDTYLAKFRVDSDFDQAVIDLLLSHNILSYEDKIYETENVSVYYANNPRAEIEASAQLIVNNKLENVQVIYLNDDYKPLIKQVYQRYGITNSLDFSQKDKKYEIGFIQTADLLINQTRKAMINFLSANPLKLKDIHKISIVNDVFKFDLKDFLEFDPVQLEIDNSRDYNQIIENTANQIIELQAILASLLIDDKIKQIEMIYNYLLENHYDSKLVRIQNKLLQKRDQLTSADNIVDKLSSILLASSNTLINSDYVSVCALNEHHYFNKEHVIILGSTIKNYPSLNQLSGVIDENYVKNLNYPQKTIRFSRQLDYLDQIKNAENLYIFYPLSNYEGKGVEPSFSLLNFAKLHGEKPKRFNLIENDYFKKRQYQLKPELAKELFFENGKLNGSISSVELYNQSSYAYFLKYGLNLFSKSYPQLSFATIGSVTHRIIEEIIQRKIDQANRISSTEITQIINEGFEPYKVLNDIKVDIVRQVLIKQFIHVVKHMETIDEDTYFKPKFLEHKFNYNVNKNISIYGYIDRVDECDNNVRVVDYKSSIKRLSANEFKRGLQLQLITYLMAISVEMKAEAAGAYYMSLKFESTNVTPASVKKTKDYYIENNEAAYHDEFIKSHRINGWHFAEGENFYHSPAHVISLSEKKDGTISTRDLLNFETVATIVEDIYKDVYNRMAEGDISLEPISSNYAIMGYEAITLTPSYSEKREMLYKNQDLKKEIIEDVDN